MDIPYTVEPRKDTGLYNAKLGMWLFLASEVMLFGGLFSAYVFLRTGVADWPSAAERLNIPLATVNTLILITSSMTMAMAWMSLKLDKFANARKFLGATVGLGALFLGLKSYEYWEKIAAGHYPSTDNFYAIYYVLTGLHFLHIAAGLLVIVYHALPGSGLWSRSKAQYTNRIEVTGLYWHFVDMVWLVLFASVYLL